MPKSLHDDTTDDKKGLTVPDVRWWSPAHYV